MKSTMTPPPPLYNIYTVNGKRYFNREKMFIAYTELNVKVLGTVRIPVKSILLFKIVIYVCLLIVLEV